MSGRVVHCKRARFDVYVGRPTPWGNPILLHDATDDLDRAEVVSQYEAWVTTSDDPRAAWVRDHVHELRGKTLGCWCAPRPCHGDVLARMAEAVS